MHSDLLVRISPAHQRRLAWFEDRQGEVCGFPEKMPDGLVLSGKAKGIYKPADLPYALSVRINLVLQQRPEISGPAGVVGFAGGGLVAASPA
jgi:hypothetical protein